MSQSSAVGSSRFHRRKAVAPLKVIPPTYLSLDNGSFPSPKGGGPIEGPSLTLSSTSGSFRFHRRKAVAPLKVVIYVPVGSSAPMFPSPKGGGPIEGTASQETSRRSERFPSPKGGGPIEGWAMSGKGRTWSFSFHRRKAVAPLKEAYPRNPPLHLVRFHRRKAVAPLKDRPGAPAHHGNVWFPSPKGGGPIEGVVAGSQSSVFYPVSIAERRWPH